MKVDLKEWEKENFPYIITWVSMSIVIFFLITRELRSDILILIAIYLPLLLMMLFRRNEVVS